MDELIFTPARPGKGMNYLTTILLLSVIIAAILAMVHRGFRAPRRIHHNSPADYGLPFEAIRIRTAAGKQLFAWWIPVTGPAPSLIILHGWGGNAGLMLPLAVPMHRAGLNVLLLDARNHGRSDSAGHSSLPRFAEDAGAAIDWVKTRSHDPEKRIALLGHSVGAGAVLLEASRRDDIAAVISIAAFAHPEWMMRRYLAPLRIPGFCKTWILHYVEWVIGFRFDEIAPMHTISRIPCPVLLVHGTADQTVPVTDAYAIRDHGRGEKPELLLIENGGHDSVKQVEQYAEQLVAFLEEHLINSSLRA